MSEQQQQIVALHKEAHKDTKINQSKIMEKVKDQHFTTLIFHEFPQASQSFPIVFLKQPKTEEFVAVSMFGLEEGENLYFKDGKWDAQYVPAAIRRFPFTLVPDPKEEGKALICIRMDKDVVSEKEGQALYDGEGNETEYLTQTKNFLQDLAEKEEITRACIKFLDNKELIQPINLTITDPNGEEKNISGLHAVNEEKLNALTNDEFIELREKGLVGPIYSHMGSLNQVQRLISMKNKARAAAKAEEKA